MRLRANRAFTLSELVILLGIVILLAALSLAGLGYARKSSLNVRCTAQLRTIHLGLAHFLNDRGYYPGMRVTTRPTTWHHALEPYITGQPIPDSAAPASPWARCPGLAPSDSGPLGYGYNQFFGNIPPNASDNTGNSAFNAYWQIRPVQVIAPASKIVIGDGRDDGVTSSYSRNALRNSTNPQDTLHPRRHFGGGHFLFADGHVERLTPEEFTTRVRTTDILKPF